MRARRPARGALVVTIALAMGGCSSLVGADFDRNAGGDDGGSSDGGELNTAYGPDGQSSAPPHAYDSGTTVIVGAMDDGGSADDDGGGSVIMSDGGMSSDASADGSTRTCDGTIQVGDLQVVEIMIETASSDDHGEWAEIKNVSPCTLAIEGLVVLSPHQGESDADQVQISSLTLTPGDTFLVADSTDTTVNHGLTSPLYGWDNAGALDEDDRIQIWKGSTLISDFSWYFPDCATNEHPCWNVAEHSMMFPDVCFVSDHDTLTKWISYSGDTYATGLYGTPNDVNPGACPN